MSTRITVTDDTSIGRCITFGNSPLVNWYLYVRGGSLYIRRDEDDVIGTEAQIVTGTLQTVVDADIIVDPTDATVAKLYVVMEGGAVYVIDVTSTPVGEQPTLQNVYDPENYSFDNPNGTFTESFEYAGGWEGTLPAIPNPDFSLAESTFTESFELDWDGTPSSFTPSTPPGSPFVHYNAQSLSFGAVSSWTNEGSDATGDLSTAGSSNDPECLSADPCVSGANYVRFDAANSEALTGTFTTTRTTGVVFAAVIRWKTNTAAGYVFDGNDAGNRMAFLRRASSTSDWSMYSGSQPTSNTKCTENKWVRVVGRFGTNGMLAVERAEILNATTGTQSLDALTLGARFDETSYGDLDITCLAMWDDGTTMLEAERWLEESYPFAAVPPGNPVFWYDPNDYSVGSVTTVVDKGSSGLDLAGVDLTVALDTDCPEQKVFVFNGTTTRMWDNSVTSTVSQPLLAGAAVRFNASGSQQDIISGRDTDNFTTPTRLHVNASNLVTLSSAPSNPTTTDYDTLAPFNTRSRWSVIQGRWNGATSHTYVDDTEVAVATGAELLRGRSIGADYNGVTWGSFLNGKMGHILGYQGTAEATTARAAEVRDWQQRHGRYATVPGAPIFDVDAETLSLTDGDPVTSWTHSGSGDTMVEATNPPTFHDTGGPETDARKRVDFNGTNQSISSNTTFASSGAPLTVPLTMATVFMPDTVPGANFILQTSTNPVLTLQELATTGRPRINDGASLTGTTDNTAAGEWRWVVGEANDASSHIEDSSGSSNAGAAGAAGAASNYRIGVNSSKSANWLDGSVARSMFWGDGTTFEQAKKYLEMRYPGVDPY